MMVREISEPPTCLRDEIRGSWLRQCIVLESVPKWDLPKLIVGRVDTEERRVSNVAGSLDALRVVAAGNVVSNYTRGAFEVAARAAEEN